MNVADKLYARNLITQRQLQVIKAAPDTNKKLITLLKQHSNQIRAHTELVSCLRDSGCVEDAERIDSFRQHRLTSDGECMVALYLL